jgi:hypothetical protein
MSEETLEQKVERYERTLRAYDEQRKLDLAVHLNEIAEWKRRAKAAEAHRYHIGGGCYVVFHPDLFNRGPQ